MDVKTSFGKNLKFYRREKRLSQEQLSEKLDVSVKHLSAIERGLTFVSAELLEKIAIFLEIPVFYLFVREKDMPYNKSLLDSIDRVIEKHLIRTISSIQTDIRQGGGE